MKIKSTIRCMIAAPFFPPISAKKSGSIRFGNRGWKKSVLKINWLENDYFVVDAGLLRIKFIHSQELQRQNSIQ